MSTHSPSLPQWNSADTSTWWSRLQLYWPEALAGGVMLIPWAALSANGFSRILDANIGEFVAWGVPHILLFGLWAGIALYTFWQVFLILWHGDPLPFDEPTRVRNWLQHRTIEKRLASFLFVAFFVTALLIRLLAPEGYQGTLREGFMQRDLLEVSCVHFTIAGFAALFHRVWVFLRTLEVRE